MSNTSIMSVREMIDTAFGEADVNIVNFKLIQAVLYLLARQLRILERRVAVSIQLDRERSDTNLSVTEMKIRATVPKKKRRAKLGSSRGGIGEEKRTDKLSVKSSKSKPLTIDKSASEKSIEKMSSKSIEKSSQDKSSATKSSSDKTSSEKTKSSTVTSTEGTKSSTLTSTDKTSSSKRTTSTPESSSKTTSGDKTTTSSKKSSSLPESSDKTTSEDKTTTSSKKSSSAKDSSDKTTTSSKKSSSTRDSSTSGDKRQDLHKILEHIEERREKELRIIHQRADSRDVGEKTPTPMASLDSVEEQYEKLLIVERVPAEKQAEGKRTPQLSIVTQEQFEDLANIVRELQGRFGPIATPDFPDNAQLMEDLRKGASLTDAMAALQLSARLEAAEKALKQMMDLVTDLAVKTGIDTEETSQWEPDLNVKHEATATSTPLTRTSRKSIVSKPAKRASKSTSMQPLAMESVEASKPSMELSKVEIPLTPVIPAAEEELVRADWVTYDELDNAIQEVIDGVLKTMTGVTTRSNVNAENAIKMAKRLEEKLDSSLNLGGRMNDLELLVSEYAEQITVLDTTLSSQMTNYQENLTQMQHDLEAGLEAMAEALANTGGDTAAVAELNSHFTNLQIDVDGSNARQRELMESQKGLSQDLQGLWQQIELLRELKSDRDEVADALRDKAGLGALNGLVSLQQFHAVRGDFEKRIGAAYDKFNNQEIVWQKAIDDLLRELNDKADWVQLVALRDDVNKIFNKLRSSTEAMLEIVGEPRSAAVTKKLFRDSACLSCSTPAQMDLEETNTLPKLPAVPPPSTRPPTIGAEDSSKPAEDGDHGICYPGLPIPHPRDPRSHICHRWCGGSHTVVTDKKSRAPVGMIITPALRQVTTAIGSDGKTYMVEDIQTRKPCLPCNEQKILNTPQPSEAEPAPVKEDFESDMTPSDFRFCSVTEIKDNISTTPPPPVEDF